MDRNPFSSHKRNRHSKTNWICPECGADNPSGERTCWGCNFVPVHDPEQRPTFLAITLWLIAFIIPTSFTAVFFLLTNYFLLIPISLVVTGLITKMIIHLFLEYRPKTTYRLQKAQNIVGISLVANLLSFILIYLILGGGAAIGKVEDGIYYLGSQGIYTQVSFLVYAYSMIHSALLGLNFVLMFFSPLLSKWPVKSHSL